MLIQKGATLVIEPNEIIEKYKGSKIEQLTIKDIENKEEQKKNKPKIKKEYKAIYKILSKEHSINEIAMKTGLELPTLYQKLFMMEIEGLIVNTKNKYKIKE